MLSENQVKRLLKQSENAYDSDPKNSTKGWIQALRLVLEENTYPINGNALNEE